MKRLFEESDDDNGGSGDNDDDDLFRRCFKRCIIIFIAIVVGHGGSLVDSAPFVRRVAGSNPALAAM